MGMLNRYSCCIPVLLLHVHCLATAIYASVNDEQRHEGHHHRKLDIPNQRWDVWSEWSPCSVDCGTGVSTRSRDCRSMLDGTISDVCRGKREEIKLCEITGCIKQVEGGCQELEQRMYGGKRYRWIPYTHPSRVCEMACRPVGAGFYLGLGRNVSDGTLCGDEEEGEDRVCVSGQCRSIGCDGVVDSNAVVDSCGVCGGNGDTCTRVKKTFTDNVRFGYHTIATIPRGATNIFISEAIKSRNYLAAKATDGSFQINIGYRLSRFGDHPGAGTIFTYTRNDGPDCPDECIKADGPTDFSVDIMMLAYRDNDGIEYSYSMPSSYQGHGDTDEGTNPVVYIDGGTVPGDNEASVNTVNGDQKRPIFSYDFKFKKTNKVSVHAEHEGVATATNRVDNQHVVGSEDTTIDTGQNEAESDAKTSTTTASPTTDSPDVVDEVGEIVVGQSNDSISIETDDEDLSNRTDALQSAKSGVITEDGSTNVTVDDMYNNDNRIPSLYSWVITSYTTCSVTCGEGKQSPLLACIVTDKDVEVDDTFCSEEVKPVAVVKECTYGPCPPSWQPGSWSKCSVSCGTGYQSRQLVCTRPNGEQVSSYECGASTMRSEERSCDMGSCTSGWFYTDWPEKCPVKCGYGTISRQVHCFSDTGNERTACPDRERPSSEKTCRGDECGAFWLTGPWSECNATCGNAYQNREIVCASKRHGRVTVVSDSACVDEVRPETYMHCDFEQCEPEWYMNEWGQCSVSCGSGYMSRDIRCLDENMRPSTGCDYTKRPADQESCTERRCPLADESKPTENRERVTPAPASAPKKEADPPKSGCTDKFEQCSMVLQARLCQYKYYQKICCGTCELAKSMPGS